MADDPIRTQLAGAAAITAALDAGRAIRLVLVRDDSPDPATRALRERCEATGIPIRVAGTREMRRLGAVAGANGEPPGSLALQGGDPDASEAAMLHAGGALWLVTGVAYPGNAGFAIRTAEVSGASGIVVDAQFGHAGRRQALRSAMRADRFFPVRFAKSEGIVEAAREAGRRIFGVEDRGTSAPWDVDLTGAALFVVGGEAGGIPPGVLAGCDAVLRIPMAGFVPSYNLQAAVAIVAAERLRQLGAR